MAYTPIRLFQTQPTTTAEATLYTVPVAKSVIVKQIILSNPTVAAATIGISLVPSGDTASNANRIVPNVTVAAKSVVTFDLSAVMATGDFLSAAVGTGTSIVIHASGVVFS